MKDKPVGKHLDYFEMRGHLGLVLSDDINRPGRVAYSLKKWRYVEEMWGAEFFPGVGSRALPSREQRN